MQEDPECIHLWIANPSQQAHGEITKADVELDEMMLVNKGTFPLPQLAS